MRRKLKGLIINDFFLKHRLCVLVLLSLVALLPFLASIDKVALLWFVDDYLVKLKVDLFL